MRIVIFDLDGEYLDYMYNKLVPLRELTGRHRKVKTKQNWYQEVFMRGLKELDKENITKEYLQLKKDNEFSE